MQEPVIRCRGLTRYFEQRAIVRDLDLEIARGTITGLLGLNGAGKSTTLRMILGLLAPTRGEARVFGVPSEELTPEHRAMIGHTVEGHFLYSWMSVRESERFHRDSHPHWNGELFEQTVRRFGIDTSARCGKLSRGQRAGVSLALMLGSKPQLLILDDPALGLDPVSRRALNETILDINGDLGTTVLLSSHLLDDVERVAEQVLVMIDGRVVVEATIDELRSRVSGWLVRFNGPAPRTFQVPGLISARTLGGDWILTVADSDHETEAAVRRLNPEHIEQVEVAFDDAVMAYLSRSRRGESFLVRSEA